MRTLFSLPKKEDFFNRYATLVPTLRKMGIFSQVVNAITEVGIIYAVVHSLLSEFWGAYAVPLAIFGALIGTALIELGLRKFLPYAARAVLHRRFAGLDLWMSVFILVATVALFSCSLFLSFKGSKAMVEAVAPPAAQMSTTEADNALAGGSLVAGQNFSRDSGEIAGRYAGLVAAQKAAYARRIEGERANLTNLRNKELRTRQSYDTQRQRIRAQINILESEQAAKVADLEGAKAGEMSGASQRKTADLARITANHSQTTADVREQNTTARLKAEKKVATYGGGLAWFTLIFHFVLILAVALEEMHRKGSDYEQVAQPNQYHFSESIWEAFTNTLSEKWNYYTRSRISRWAAKTPAPPKPSEPPTLYELSDWKPRRITLISAPRAEAGETGKTPPAGDAKRDRTGAARASKTFALDVERLRVSYPAGLPYNAFRYGKRRPAGGAAPPKIERREVDKSLKPCAHCGKDFRPRTTWQKFCSEPCKLAYHEARHGGKFEPGHYRNRNRE